MVLTTGVLPDHIYGCLNQKEDAVVCTAGAVWHDDDGGESTVVETTFHEATRKAGLHIPPMAGPATTSNTVSQARRPF